MTRIAIIGAGDLGLQIAHLVSLIPDKILAGYFDDTKPEGEMLDGSPVFGGIDAIDACFARGDFDELVMGIGYRHMAVRQSLFARFHPQVPFAKLIHPRAWVDPTASVKPGAVLLAGTIVDMRCSIGANTLLNVGCVIAHDSSVGDGSFLSPAINLAGFVKIGAGNVLGIGTVVIDNITIASGVRTGAGAVVTEDLVEPGLYLGIPARIKRSVPSHE
jgi:sugar O-acyltransferase (sialic acid O-acetyltransferase NeuD family)